MQDCRCTQDFEELLLFGSHVDRIIVLRDGVNRLEQGSALPDYVVRATAGQTDVRRFLERLEETSEDTAADVPMKRLFV